MLEECGIWNSLRCFIFVVFLLELDECRPVHLNPREHTEFRWVSREEAIQLATSHTNAEAILKWVPELPL